MNILTKELKLTQLTMFNGFFSFTGPPFERKPENG